MREATGARLARALRIGAIAAAGAAVLGAVAVTPGEPGRAAEASVGDIPLDVEGEVSERPWTRYDRWPDRDAAAFNSLADAARSPAPAAAPAPVEGPMGDAAKGKELVADRSKGGSCLACHVMGQAGGANLPGNVGLDLSMVAAFGRDDAYLYNYIHDPRVFNPTTVMPPWGAHGVLTDQEIRDIVAFLKTLDSPAVFTDPRDDPWQRPVPVEDRDGQDPLVNPAMWEVETAEGLWQEEGPAGQACASCHADPAAELATFAARMPRYEPRLDKVMGVEEFITRHARATTGHEWLMQSAENTAMNVYLRYLALGTPIEVDVESAGAMEAFELGAKLYDTKIGQLNFACSDCHGADKGANKWIRGQWLGEASGQLPHFPVYRTSRDQIWDIRKRFQWCNVSVWANELVPEAAEYGALELYLAKQNEGLPMNAPGIRH